MRFLLILVAMFALIVPLPALADAHPGLHVNPHFPNVVLYLALGLAAFAWIGMAVTLAVLRRRRRQAIEDRLDLRDARRAIRDLRNGRTRLVSHDEVKRRLGL